MKGVKIDETLLWRAYRNSPTLFRTVPSPTPYDLLFSKIGVCNPHPKLKSQLSQEGVKDFKFGQNIHRVYPNISPLNSLETRERGRIQGLSNFWVPQLSQERIKLRTSNLVGYSQGPSEKSPFKNFGEKGAWAYPGTAQIF